MGVVALQALPVLKGFVTMLFVKSPFFAFMTTLAHNADFIFHQMFVI